jgi:soluble lytic murein transglycosylase
MLKIGLSLAFSLLMSTSPLLAQEALTKALQLGAAGIWPEALAQAELEGPIARDIVEWQRLRAGTGTAEEYEDFLKRRADWPGMPLLHEKGEKALAETQDAGRIVSYFSGQSPETGAGAVALIGAFLKTGQKDAALAEARRAWVNLPFAPEDEAAMLLLFPEMPMERHEQRLERLLWDGDLTGAKRMLGRVGKDWQALAAAVIALGEQADGVDALIAAVPERFKDHPGLAHARFDWRMRKDLYDESIDLILSRSPDAAGLGRAEAWAERRALLARRLLRQGEGEKAYQLAAGHGLQPGGGASAYADLEFLAGFIALRRLNNPERALQHFVHLEGSVQTDISRSRALYWKGRALEAAGSGQEALAAFTTASSMQTAYYGQLAAEHLGLPLDKGLLDNNEPPDWRNADFVSSSVLEAGLLLIRAGDRTLAKRFLLHLAESQPKQGLEQLADMALRVGEPHIALLIAKQAAERGFILPRAYYPSPEMIPVDGLPVSRALALAISRRESEFDPAAQSHAGARGLMQVMPATGEKVAKRLNVAFKTADLTDDPAKNVTLGSAYLAEMIDEFGPSVALVASGYNAGPGRPRRWIEEFGDPRHADVDIVDWVEMIPFNETRTYVMRVSESLVIYRARLKGQVGPVSLRAELKGG